MSYLTARYVVVEGPDYVGKSTFVRDLHLDLGMTEEIVKLAFPANREDVPIRDLLFNSVMNDYRSGAAFLFMADFVLAHDLNIKPRRRDGNLKFILDRFVPTLCVYQKVPLVELNSFFSKIPALDEFMEDMSQAHYVFLDPTDLDSHLGRMRSRLKQGDTNSYDPTTIEDVKTQIEDYRKFVSEAYTHGILGSKRIDVIGV
jgi:thymidylate kinase